MLNAWLPSLAAGQIFHAHFTSVLSRSGIILLFYFGPQNVLFLDALC